MLRFLRYCVLLSCMVAGILVLLAFIAELRPLPTLQDGDIIMQTTNTDQSLAIGLSTFSLYTHAGIVRRTGDRFSVVETRRTVQETPLHEWIENGIGGRFSVHRHKALTPEHTSKIVEQALRYLGRPYDYYFLESDSALYCSELVHDAYAAAGLNAGQMQNIGSLWVNNAAARTLIERRWRSYPLCTDYDITFEECYGLILDEQIVTPVSLTRGADVEEIYSNYPF